MSSQMRAPLAEHRRNLLQESSRQRQARARVLSHSPSLTTITTSTFISRWQFAELCRLGRLRAGGDLENPSPARCRDAVRGVKARGLALTPLSCDPGLSEPGCRRLGPMPHAGGRFSPSEPTSKLLLGSSSIHLPQTHKQTHLRKAGEVLGTEFPKDQFFRR